MKATNIFNSLRSKGVCGTDGIPPKLPGVSSPLDKKLVGNQKNLPQQLKDKIEAAPESPANYGSVLKKNDDKKYGKLISQDTDEKTGITTSRYDVGTNMPKIVRTKKKSPVEKASCGYKK
jgi:hypothetical protein